MFIAALILATSLGFLIQFFIAYSRSLISQAYAMELSEQAHIVTGIDDHHVQGNDFHRLMELLHLCPGQGQDRVQLGLVKVYYSLLAAARMFFRGSEWIARDQKSCSYFVAVSLDRRMAANRALMQGMPS